MLQRFPVRFVIAHNYERRSYFESRSSIMTRRSTRFMRVW